MDGLPPVGRYYDGKVSLPWGFVKGWEGVLFLKKKNQKDFYERCAAGAQTPSWESATME
jgi:hypothetical protein